MAGKIVKKIVWQCLCNSKIKSICSIVSTISTGILEKNRVVMRPVFIIIKTIVMKEQIILNIPEPCHENWNEMTPVEKGKHCTVCQKNVVDFSADTDEAILDFFKNYNGSTCGRFSEEQLNRPLITYELKPASKFLKYAAGLLLPGLFLSKASAQKKDIVELKEIVVTGYPQNMIGKVSSSLSVTRPTLLKQKDTISIKLLPSKPIEELLVGTIGMFVVESKKVVSGIVVDEIDGSPLPSASVMIEGNNIATTTNADGSFSLAVNEYKGVLRVTCIGYEPCETNLRKEKGEEVVIKMKMVPLVEVIAGAVAVTRVHKPKPEKALSRVKDTVVNFFFKREIKVYPNPVATNATLQINFGNSNSGMYQIYLLNSSGQLYYSFQKQISSLNQTEQIHLSDKMSAGVYVLQIIDERKRLVQTSKIIVQ